MSYDYPTTYSTNGSRSEPASLTEPNQFNYANFGCRYDCGWGCGVPDESVPYEVEPNGEGEDEDEGGSEADTISTLVDDEDALATEYQHENVDDELDPEIHGEWENTSISSDDSGDQTRSPDVEPCVTREQSTAPSRGSSDRSQSPMPTPEGIRPIPLPPIWPVPIQPPTKYLFRNPPLQLTPQCRGHPTDTPYWDDRGDWRS